MGENGSFSFAVYDAEDNEVILSSEDAVKRIEASNYFVKLDSTGGQFDISAGMSNSALNEAVWKEELTACSGTYTFIWL